MSQIVTLLFRLLESVVGSDPVGDLAGGFDLSGDEIVGQLVERW